MSARAYIHVRLVALAAAAGCVDAASFLGLDQVFTANQTGNTVLLGIALGEGDGAAIARTGVSVAGFLIGVMLAGLVVRELAPGWHVRISALLVAEALLLVVIAALWGPLGTIALIALVSLAMGLQSAVGIQIGVPGVSTTFVSGTMTRMGMQFVRRRGTAVESAPPLTWLAYLGGAVAGGALSRWTSGSVTILVGAAILVVSALPVRAVAPRSHPTR